MGKKGKSKGPVIPPGMSEEWFMCTQDTLGCSLVLSGINSTPSKAPMPCHFTKGQAAQYLWQNALVSKDKLDEAVKEASVQAAIKCIQVSPLLNEKTLSAGLLECCCLEEKWRDYIMTQCIKPYGSIVPALVSCLNAGSAAAEVSAFRALRALCDTDDVRPIVCKHLNNVKEGWHRITSCIRDCLDPMAKLEGCNLLVLCLQHDPASRVKISDWRSTFDCLQDTVANPKWGEAVRGMAMRAIRFLLIHRPNKEVLLKRDGLALTIDYCKECSKQDSLFDFEARCAGANVMWQLVEDRTLPYGLPKTRDAEDTNITEPSPEMKARAFQCIINDAVEPLVVMCCGPSPSDVLKEPPPPPGKKGKKAKGKKKKGKGPPMPPGGEDCMQFAVGALRALTLWEEGRDALCAAVDGYGCRAVVLLLESKVEQTRWHATGVLLNIAAHGTRVPKLEAAGAPPYLTNVPPRRVNASWQSYEGPVTPRPVTSLGDPRPSTGGPDAAAPGMAAVGA